jgi:2-keto-4-pentenoate hydratase/2-oxohepta-3-ene-1,7-dioic acid hydratase in catechol pathway
MKIICVGMNYSKHNKELGETLLKPDSPVIFMKPDSSILRNRRPFFLPDNLGRIDYEAEVVVRISRLGKSIAANFADRYWDAVTLGIDFTARDMQTDFRSKGLPWELCKGFDGSAVIGDWIPREEAGDIENLRFRAWQISGGCSTSRFPESEGFRIRLHPVHRP